MWLLLENIRGIHYQESNATYDLTLYKICDKIYNFLKYQLYFKILYLVTG